MKKLNLIPILLLETVIMSSVIQAEEVAINGNVGVMSNYIYRGMTQTNDKASVNTGINIFYNGFYRCWSSGFNSRLWYR
ncbi:MAG: hypothetical protein DRQ78_02170 [Epsilonproteobacteria bacterium]|nr:MAG: hypothetical protein DRQ78_02170 [Campylobacterota bacterium]